MFDDEIFTRLMPTDILIKIKAASVNQFDILLRQGYFAKGEELNRPYVPGSDASGVVVQKGRNVTGLHFCHFYEMHVL